MAPSEQAIENGSSATTMRSSTSRWKFGDIGAMNEITKSPYEGTFSAEVGEPLFDQVKKLLLSEEELQGEVQDMDGMPTLTVQPEAVELFGAVLADNLVRAYHVIAKSGILFTSNWLEHKQCKIRGERCGWIAKPMFLLLLQEQRFAKASDALLASVINSIGVPQMFFDALKEWNLDEPNLQCNEPSIQFATKKRECWKCLIFVVRAYRCSKMLQKKEDDISSVETEDPGLFTKVRMCLQILNQHVKVHPKRLEEHLAQRQAAAPSEDEEVPSKRPLLEGGQEGKSSSQKRQKIDQAGGSAQSVSSSITSDEPVPSSRPSLPDTSNVDVSKTVACKPNNEVPLIPPPDGKSLEELLAIAKVQYRRLGNTIKRMKKQVDEKKEHLREQVRREIMQELQEEGVIPNDHTMTARGGWNASKNPRKNTVKRTATGKKRK